MGKLSLIKRVILWLIAVFLMFWSIRKAVIGQLPGTFEAKEIPEEYIALKDFIVGQKEFFRIFWIPKRQRFGFWSNNHPGVAAEEFFTESNCKEPSCFLRTEMPAKWGEKCFPNDRCYVRELDYFLNLQTKEILSKMAVKYVVIPFDSQGEIFIAERKYNPQQRGEVEQLLDTIPWLKKIEVVDKIAVYELSGYKDHFFIDQFTEKKTNKLVSWKMINPTKYLVSLNIVEPPASLVFSETYDQLWHAQVDGQTVASKPYEGFLNSFEVDKKGDWEITVEFTGQKYVYWGGIVSLFTLLLSLGYLFYKFLRN